eukprot:9875215-Karenia_brevis.AAC.1
MARNRGQEGQDRPKMEPRGVKTITERHMRGHCGGRLVARREEFRRVQKSRKSGLEGSGVKVLITPCHT